VQRLFHTRELLGFLLLELPQRDAGPAGDDELDVFLLDRLGALALVLLPLALELLVAVRSTFSFSRSEAAFSNSWASRYMSFSRMTRSSSFSISFISGGGVSAISRVRDEASSITSMALSGSWRSVM
jgi:hypothetical protein